MVSCHRFYVFLRTNAFLPYKSATAQIRTVALILFFWGKAGDDLAVMRGVMGVEAIGAILDAAVVLAITAAGFP